MPEIHTLTALPRTITGKATSRLRKGGLIPAVMYGHGVNPANLQVARVGFEKLYRNAGESSLVDLTIAGMPAVKVLIQDIQVDPLRGDITHIDFRQVRMDEKLEAEITLEFSDESAAVKELGGTLVRNLTHLEVRCLPNALVHEIKVSLLPLKTFEAKIHVRDIAVPEGIEVLTPADEVIALVEEPRSEEELAALEAVPEAKVEEVVVATEEKKAEREKEKEEEAGK